MTIWALADLHLAISTPSKSMEVFGSGWTNYMARIRAHWIEKVSPNDLVLIPGDICWAMRLEEAKADLAWIEALPGTKLLLRGNHDYWWSSPNKMRQAMPPSIHFLQYDVFMWHGVAIGGSRLWDTPEYGFESVTQLKENPRQKEPIAKDAQEDENIFLNELKRLERSLEQIPQEARYRIAMTHYPPIGADLAPSRASLLLERFKIDLCVFGHLHSIRQGALPFGKARGVDYKFVACDYLECIPLQVWTDAS